MKYRDIEYTLVQGIGRNMWKSSVTFDADLSARDETMTQYRRLSVPLTERSRLKSCGLFRPEAGIDSPPWTSEEDRRLLEMVARGKS